MNVKPTLQQLVHGRGEYFVAPYTLVVMLDRQACGGNLVESVWWSEWQQFMLENDLGFLFVTSKIDSIDLAIAIALDSVEAPILVLPDSNQVVSDLWSPGASSPLKLLIDSTAHIFRGWLSIRDVSESQSLLNEIDSIIQIK